MKKTLFMAFVATTLPLASLAEEGHGHGMVQDKIMQHEAQSSEHTDTDGSAMSGMMHGRDGMMAKKCMEAEGMKKEQCEKMHAEHSNKEMKKNDNSDHQH